MEIHINETREAGILFLQICRPEKKNALSREMYAALSAGLRAGDADDNIKVIILHGLEGCFTSGNDLEGFKNGSSADGNYPHNHFLDTLITTKKPVIAVVSGLALGIGTILLFHCDFVYASPDSKFSLPFVKLGLSPEGATSYILPQRIGHQRAAEIIMLGENFNTGTAKEIGLINRVVPDDRLMSIALETAGKLASYPQDSLMQIKALLKKAQSDVVTNTRKSELTEFNKRLNSPQVIKRISGFYERKVDRTA